MTAARRRHAALGAFASRSAVLATAWLAAVSAAGWAQAAEPRPAGPGPKSTGALPTQLQFRSALAAFQPHTDPPVQSWREANDRVGRIGGWKAYAKEAQAARKAAGGQPAVDPHAGHSGAGRP